MARWTRMLVRLGLCGVVTLGCSGPQSLTRAIRAEDEQAYMNELGQHADSPKQAYFAWKSQQTGTAVEQIEREDGELSSTRNPFDANRDSVAVSRGAVLYKVHCMSCHGDSADGRGLAMVNYLPKMNFHAFDKRFAVTVHRGAPRAWFKKINEGYTSAIAKPDGSPNTMPAFKDTLAREQIWLTITYLQSLDMYSNSAAGSEHP